MPTYERTPQFDKDYEALSADEKAAFKRAIAKFVADMPTGSFRKGLRVKGLKSRPGAFEMTWAGDGRAVFTYGKPVRKGEPHIVWLAVGTHDVL